MIAIEESKKYGLVQLDPACEELCRTQLRAYLTGIGQWSIDKNIEELVSLESGVCERFQYFLSKVPATVLARLLVSGCSVGSELIIARNQFGFQNITGTEVVADYIKIAHERLIGQEGIRVDLYDGKHLPYADNEFTALASGHIIEHTPSPYEYLCEHMRVLAPGGYFFLEFPDRYHPIELHTNLPSVEHLPWPIRDLALIYRASFLSPYPPEKRKLFSLVRRTLKPVSVDLIRKFLKSIDPKNSRILHHYEPAPGFMRLIIEKRASA